MGDGGKGSAPRPFSVSDEDYSKNWDAIFGRKKDDVSKVLSERNEEASANNETSLEGHNSQS